MAAWQEANNYEVTGILTTLQRAALLDQYNSILDGLGLEVVHDETAGIEIEMPTAEVALTPVPLLPNLRREQPYHSWGKRTCISVSTGLWPSPKTGADISGTI